MLMVLLLTRDLTIMISHKFNLISKIKFQSWSENNCMILNTTKAKEILVSGKRLGKRMNCLDPTVSINQVKLEQVNSYKVLGFVIDHKLLFHEHKLCGKISRVDNMSCWTDNIYP